MHVHVVLLQPFSALLHCAAELAILGAGISLWLLAGRSERRLGGVGEAYFWWEAADCREVSFV